MRTIGELVEEYGFSEKNLRYIIGKGVVKSYQCDGAICIDDEDSDYLINMMTLPKLSDFVGRSHKRYDTIQRMCYDGRLNAIKFMGHWRLYMDSVEIVKRMCNHYSLSEMSNMIGINSHAIHMMTIKGYLSAEKLGGMNYYSKEAYKKLKEYENRLTKADYMYKYKTSEQYLNKMIKRGEVETFKFGKRTMIKDN